MARTLLQIVNAAQQELGLATSSSVVGNTLDTTATQMLALVQAEIDELRRAHNWTKLHVEYNLVVNIPTIVTGSTTLDSAVVTVSSTAGIVANYFTIIGSGIPVAARVLSVDSATQVTMTMKATGASSGATITFCQDTYPEPTDFDHYENKTWWDRTNHWQLMGPDSPQDRQFLLSGIVATGPRRHFSNIGYGANDYRIWPPPVEITSPLQLVYEYITNYAVYTAGVKTAPNQFWTLDTDQPILDDRAIILGLKYRFWQIKGMNYAMMRKDYDDYVQRLIARDGGARTLSLTPRNQSMYLSGNNIMDGFWPGSTGTNTA